jgi:MazG family protein
MNEISKTNNTFGKLVEILDVLRGEKGCPWDREQDENTIVNYFLEEVYEAVDAVVSEDPQSLKEELGDVLMEVVFLTRIFKEKNEFTIHDVLEGINQKMIRRHPHVFGPQQIENSARVVDLWNQQKKKEKERHSVLDGLATHLPSLLKAFQIGQRVSLFGFDWKLPLDALEKVREELDELEEALQADNKEQAAEEIGDVLFSMANISRHLDVNPEIALRQTNDKFSKRFRYIEERLKERGEKIGKVSLDELDILWEEAKEKTNSNKE